MTIAYRPTYRTIGWEELSPFLRHALMNNQDVDKDVLFLQRGHLKVFHCEGIYCGDQLVGFGRHDTKYLHLAQLYISPAFRGHGLARKFIDSRQIQGLWVIPANLKAIELYKSMGFQIIGSNVNRLYMSRLPFHLAKMPA